MSGERPTSSRLREWRIEQDYTLEECADLTGLSIAFWSRIERRERQPRPETRIRIARRLGVPVRDLFEVEPLEELNA